MKIEFKANVNWKWLIIELGVWLIFYHTIMALVPVALLPFAMFLFGAATIYFDIYFSKIFKE